MQIRVAILDDHQSVLDGYLYRLAPVPEIQVVAVANYGDDLEQLLAVQPVDVLILDVSVPTSPTNPFPYPIFHAIPLLLQRYPSLVILVISMHDQRSLIRAVMETGVSGYILKDDHAALKNLGNIIYSVSRGGIYFSQRAYAHMLGTTQSEQEDELLTPRQLEVLSLCATFPDMPTSELARMINVAHSTVRNLLSSSYLRLGVKSRAAAVAIARQQGLITPSAPIEVKAPRTD